MRSALLLFCGLLALSALPLMSEATAAASSGSEVIASFHQVGAGRFAAQEKLSKLQEVWELPETASLVEQTCSRLALAPGRLCLDLVSESQREAVSKLLQPLLKTLFTQESYLDCRSVADGAVAWRLGVRLDPSQRTVWQKNLKQIASLTGFEESSEAQDTGVSPVHYQRNDTKLTLQIQAGWLTLGNDQGVTAPGATAPVLPLGEAWLRADLDLAKLAAPLGLPVDLNWPRVEMSVFGEGSRQRTEMDLHFEKNALGPVLPWQVPTNTICDPLVSFAAIRGISQESWWSKLLDRVGIVPPPDQLYTWAQSDIVAQSFMVFPFPDATNVVRQLPGRLLEPLASCWGPGKMPGRLEWRASEGMSIWKSLPFIVPRAWPLLDGGVSYIAAGLFPPSPRKDAPPQELLDQFLGQEDLVAYAWEYTPVRLAQLRHMAQLTAVLLETPQMSTHQAGIPWTMGIERLLGNSITKVHAKSGTEWSLLRRSAIGLTAAELVVMTRWLESEAFPRFGLAIEEQPAPAAKPRAPKQPSR